MSRTQNVSEETANIIDSEVKRLVQTGYDEAKREFKRRYYTGLYAACRGNVTQMACGHTPAHGPGGPAGSATRQRGGRGLED